ncbi:DNA polymerase III subunit epsilon [Candidatus Hodgkinia cicadicola]|uniref:DNA-directed DNA polymerase n=1 Tax=Candidatus Hodgkinia cicadicola TaxID=573658 RepID=A0ABX4MII7_9HYPH|nr:DNA polymerase III subunit epsilon [Candidatus Hodgkinia cicadicola]PIM96650.1 DNA polymerase III subunit epsilon [Candidatus Hodgkinia cicadicola]
MIKLNKLLNTTARVCEIVIDTETTGLDPKRDRIIELAAIEIINGKKTSRIFHSYFNPFPIKVNISAIAIHGLTNEFLSTKPKFKDRVDQFLDLIKNRLLVAHNAVFDAAMINNELTRIGLINIPNNRWIDTLKLARNLFPGKRNSLSILCKRYKLKSNGQSHSAINDCENLLTLYNLMYFDKTKSILKLSND